MRNALTINDPDIGGGGPTTVDAPAGGRTLNPPFDSRLTSTGGNNPALTHRPLKRGRIVRSSGVGYQVNFMYNPSVLDVAFSYDQSIADEAKTDPTVTAAYVGEGQLGLNLLFDRTYEVWERGNTVAAKFGVHADVLAFYAYLDMIDPNFTTASTWESLYPRSQVVRKNSYLYIGERLKYFGYITSLAIQYTHWAYDMVPSRAAIGVQFTVVTADSRTISDTGEKTTITDPTKLPDQPGDPTLGGLFPR